MGEKIRNPIKGYYVTLLMLMLFPCLFFGAVSVNNENESGIDTYIYCKSSNNILDTQFLEDADIKVVDSIAAGGVEPDGTDLIQNDAAYIIFLGWASNDLLTFHVSKIDGRLEKVGDGSFKLPIVNPFAIITVPIDSEHNYVYVTGFGSDAIALLKMNSNEKTFELSLNKTSLHSKGYMASQGGSGPASLAYDVDTRTLYVSNKISNNISVYKVENDGDLSYIDSFDSHGVGPRKLKLLKIGWLWKKTYLYAVNESSNSVATFDISNKDSIKFVSSVDTGFNPISLSINSNQKYAYTSNTLSNTVSMYKINQSTGALIPLNPATVSSNGVSPYGIYSLKNKLYVINKDSNSVAVFDQTDGYLKFIKRIIMPSECIEPKGLVHIGE